MTGILILGCIFILAVVVIPMVADWIEGAYFIIKLATSKKFREENWGKNNQGDPSGRAWSEPGLGTWP